MPIANIRLIISGFALMLFGLIFAVCSQYAFVYIFAGLGLFLIIIGCAVKDIRGENSNK